ncbi:MAG: glycosyltransferase family 2 protein [Phycisphaerae bacterium]|nr:glycosyltransferase family 2 protein [Phycisphaerae bacterium]
MMKRPRVEPTPTIELSVICPAYNEEGAITDAVTDVVREVFPIVAACELIVVNDGSRDRTGESLDTLAAAEPRLRVIHQANAGHGPALRRGLDEALGEWVLLIDSDRQMPLERFGDLWLAARTGDAAFAVRCRREDPVFRLILTRLVRVCVRTLFGTRIQDLNVPFKVLRRDHWLEMKPFIPPETLAPSLFVSIVSVWKGHRIAEVEVSHRARKTGVVSIRRWRLLKFCARGLGQLLTLRLRLWREPRPRLTRPVS